ncbi:Uncharacterised protein [Vibrio cholerae]|uniref:Uncharacterized protein n=1 Tax=Vibrio cholerae TaxID=666 RepID=A0A655Y271_VIBCL|nr:Uncharacterised protein [Vibrio cholerae]CSC28548.1 Uncharacterised protein [Vibrio cholerae]CSC52030.1 Uncharacterised protein [Vibrio cholerae]CSC60994.1 Uncharacterised protein [Vibrio cholerae]CSC70301.1 Uncharacterised protein [Vibrio cholerae]
MGNRGIGAVGVRHVTHRHHRTKTHQAVTARSQNGQRFLRTIQRLQIGSFLPFFARFTSPQNRCWNHLHIQLTVELMFGQQLRKQRNRVTRHMLIATQQRWARSNKHIALESFAIQHQRL